MGEQAPEEIDENWIVDLEISMVKAFGWDLHAIDETAIESLLPFVHRFGRNNEQKKAYADQVDWL